MIEVGEYVRVNGIMGKVEQIGNSLFWLEDGSSYSLTDKKIKHSKNIMDLIEVGDILKIKEGNDIFYIGLEKNTTTIKYADFKDSIENGECELLAILTKEQYNANCYKVKGE